jgi:hypothetical protein
MRNSISGISGLPSRHVLPPLGQQQQQQLPYGFNQPAFFPPFLGEQSTVQWTNPNPFAAAASEPGSNAHSPNFSQQFPPDSASSSSSAPSPPADLEIPPHDQARIPAAPDFLHPGAIGSEGSTGPLPFDLFKSAGQGPADFYRPRGLSILNDGMAMGGMPAMQNSDYSHAIQTAGLVGEIPTHDDITLDHYYHGTHNTHHI